MPPKKRLQQGSKGIEIGQSNKRVRGEKGKDKEKSTAVDKERWPQEFKHLYKIFKTLNSFLAFCSTRKHLATTFPVIRSSVEGLLGEPLDLERVAEIKALLPDLVKFAYIPKSLHVFSEKHANRDVFTTAVNRMGSRSYADLDDDNDNEQVLVLEFLENKRSGGGRNQPDKANLLQIPLALNANDVRELTLKRNERFEMAVEELLAAVPLNENPMMLLRAAAIDHVPVLPSLSRLAGNSTSPMRPPIPSASTRSSIPTVLDNLSSCEWYINQITFRRSIEAKLPETGELKCPLSDTIRSAFENVRSIKSLYSHQALAINSIMNDRNVVVSTSTASGKSVIYQAPLLTFLEEDEENTMMLIFPTKALAQDQKIALQQLVAAIPNISHLKVETYDGDTPKDVRSDIRSDASVIFTNFDMLHASILPHEDTWRRFLRNLKLVVVDELHYYSGVFGSHVAQIMRRLRRVCAALGNRQTRFVSCSATIRDPLEHMQAIFGIDSIDVVDNDGAPAGAKDFVVWRPPLLDAQDVSLGTDNPLRQAVILMQHLILQGVRTIMFCKFRKMCEMAMKALRTELSAGHAELLDKVVAYRGGYSPEDRRRIEQDAFGGRLLGIVATNALELGVDIGVLDAVILLGFPYTLSNLRQQAGRAGRRARDALVALVVDNNSLDQHYLQNPDELFSSPTESLNIELDSPVILEAHLQCASQEMPLCLEDERYFGPLFKQVCETKLVKDAQGWFHPNPRYLPYPSQHIAIRGLKEENYVVLEVPPPIDGVPIDGSCKRILEEIETSRALFETYEGGVFLHQGKSYVVQEVNHDTRIANVYRADVNWTTRPRDFTDIDAICTRRIREIRGSKLQSYYGDVDIQTTVFGFYKIRNGIRVDSVSLETPPFLRRTTGWWLDIPEKILIMMRERGFNLAEGIHSACHVILNQFAMQRDLRTECKLAAKEYKSRPSRRKRPARLIFYEGAGKSGIIAAKAFDVVSNLIHSANEAVESCKCTNGCFECIDGPYCKEGNEVSSKIGAQVIIRGLLGMPINLDALPSAQHSYDPEMDTISEAVAVPLAGKIMIETDA